MHLKLKKETIKQNGDQKLIARKLLDQLLMSAYTQAYAVAPSIAIFRDAERERERVVHWLHYLYSIAALA